MFRPLLCFAVLCAFATTAQAQRILSMEEALERAEAEAPRLRAAAARLEAARQEVRSADVLPDPELLLGLENLPVNGPMAGRWGADLMTMRRIGVMQRFPAPGKLDLRAEAAQAETREMAANLVSEQLALREEVAQAWIMLHFAERRLQALQPLREALALRTVGAEAPLLDGRSRSVDVLEVQRMQWQLDDRADELEADRMAARAELQRWVSDADGTRGEPDPATTPGFVLEQVSAMLPRHRDLIGWRHRLAAADARSRLARADKRPDWALELAYAERAAPFDDMASVMLRVDLPVRASRRQDPMHSARLAEYDALDAQFDARTRAVRAEIEARWAAWHAAQRRWQRASQQALPLARDATAVALEIYRGGGGSLMDWARAFEAEAELTFELEQRAAETCLAASRLNHLFVEENQP